MSAIIKKFWELLTTLHLRPVSLAGKCRVLFGAAILLVLFIALLMPYFWMGKLTEKAVLDSGRAVVNTVYERHFKIGAKDANSTIMLEESGARREAQSSRVKWLRLDKSQQEWQKQLSNRQRETIEQMAKQNKISELAWAGKVGGSYETTYINLVRANKKCLSCHSVEGSAPVFSVDEPVGAILVQMPGRETSRTLLFNWICVITAGLFAGSRRDCRILCNRSTNNPKPHQTASRNC